MNCIKTSFNQVKNFVISDTQDKIIAVIKINPLQDITTKILQAISEDEDLDKAELLNSFVINENSIYIISVKINFKDEEEEYKNYNLTPVAIY